MLILSAGEPITAALLLGVVFMVAATIVTLLGAWVYRAERRNRSHPHGPSPS